MLRDLTFWAVSSRRLSVLKALLLCHVPIHPECIYYACLRNDPEAVRVLLKAGAPVEYNRWEMGQPIVTMALIYNRNYDMAKMLADAGADLTDDRILPAVCEAGDAERVRYFIEKGANVEDRDCTYRACSMNRLEMLRILLDAGAPIHDNAIYWACHHRNLEMFELLRERGARLSDGAMSAALYNKDVLHILQGGYPPPFPSKNDRAIAEILLDTGPRLYFFEAVHYACRTDDMSLLQLIIDKKKERMKKRGDERLLTDNCLYAACLYGRPAALRILLENGAVPGDNGAIRVYLQCGDEIGEILRGVIPAEEEVRTP